MLSLERDFALSAPPPALKSLWKVQVNFAQSVSFLVAESMSPTFTKVPAEAHFTGGSNDYYPGNADIDGLSITFYEVHNHLVGNWLTAWQKKIYDPQSHVFGLPAEFKADIIVNLYSRQSRQPTKVLTYKGCWPTDRGPYELSYDDETGRITIVAQFAVDELAE